MKTVRLEKENLEHLKKVLFCSVLICSNTVKSTKAHALLSIAHIHPVNPTHSPWLLLLLPAMPVLTSTCLALATSLQQRRFLACCLNGATLPRSVHLYLSLSLSGLAPISSLHVHLVCKCLSDMPPIPSIFPHCRKSHMVSTQNNCRGHHSLRHVGRTSERKDSALLLHMLILHSLMMNKTRIWQRQLTSVLSLSLAHNTLTGGSTGTSMALLRHIIIDLAHCATPPPVFPRNATTIISTFALNQHLFLAFLQLTHHHTLQDSPVGGPHGVRQD